MTEDEALDFNVRVKALNTAVDLAKTAHHEFETADVIKAAQTIEAYLKGEPKEAAK